MHRLKTGHLRAILKLRFQMPERTIKMKHLIQFLKAGALYFALVFGAGAVLGTVRVLWLVPRFGTRRAELMESPVMLVVIILAAEWIVRRSDFEATLPARLCIGVTALVMMVAAELILVLQLAGLSMNDYLASRDPVATAVYYVLLGVFGIMPMLVARGRISAENKQ